MVSSEGAISPEMGETSLFKLNHSMVRVTGLSYILTVFRFRFLRHLTDPEASLKFYKHLGLRVLQEFQLPDHKLDLYFLAYGMCQLPLSLRQDDD